MEKAEASAKAAAEHWRRRAEGIRAAAKQVRATETMVEELHNLKFKPSVEVRLASLLSKKQLKPADLLAKMDNDKNGSVSATWQFHKGSTAPLALLFVPISV